MAKPNVQKDIVLVRPRVTEKSAIISSNSNIHVFEVTKDATKHSISRSIKQVFDITPEKVRIVPIPKKAVFVRGKKGVKGGGKKAYVYLKKGDTIKLGS